MAAVDEHDAGTSNEASFERSTESNNEPNATTVNSSVNLSEIKQGRQRVLDEINRLQNDLQSWETSLSQQFEQYRNDLQDTSVRLDSDLVELEKKLENVRSSLKQRVHAAHHATEVELDTSGASETQAPLPPQQSSTTGRKHD